MAILRSIHAQKHELASQPQKSNPLTAWLFNIWQSFVGKSVYGDEPQVWCQEDSLGQIWWSAYDPISGRSQVYCTEEEMMKWIDELHH
jgi:hypothetical protein